MPQFILQEFPQPPEQVVPHIDAHVVHALLHPEHEFLQLLMHLSEHVLAHVPVHDKHSLLHSPKQSIEHDRLQLVAQLFSHDPVHSVQVDTSLVGILSTPPIFNYDLWAHILYC